MILSRSNIAIIQNGDKVAVMKRIKQAAALLFLLAAGCGSTWAQVSCVVGANTPRNDTVTLNPPTISAGVDMPNGTIIYQGRMNSGWSGWTCTTNLSSSDETIYYDYNYTLSSAPLPLSSWSGSPFGGAVYQTGIPGIGVAVSLDGTSSVLTSTAGIRAPINASVSILNNGGKSLSLLPTPYFISLVKIGTLTPGSYTLSAASLPSFRFFFSNGSNGLTTVIGFPMIVQNTQFQGQLNISTQTCMTPDVNVEMGTYEKLTSFTGQGSVTPWVDASITLSGCPAFYGYYNNNNYASLFNYNTGGSSIPASTNNNVGVRLTPSTSVIDSTNGIMAIDASSPNSASGVGIQLGWGSASGNPTLFDFATEKQFQLPKDGSPVIRVPLAARYIQTTPMVTPGRADGKAVFLINYY